MNLPNLTLSISVVLTLAMLSVALFLAFVRLARGPSLPDRVVALDLISTLVVGMIATYTIATRQSALLDAAVVVALTAFLAVVGFARYVERGPSWIRDPRNE